MGYVMTRPGSKPGSIFEGRTLDDAVRKGLEALGLSRAEVMITMLEEGSSGFLGLGARPYKVRIMPGKHGTDAVTRVLIETTDHEREWTTVGVHGNVIEASWLALHDAVRYGLLGAVPSV